MAMFGDDVAPYTTPDGRTVTLPSQLADQFQGLTPAGQQSIGPAPGTRPPVDEVAGPGQPPAPPPGNAPPELPSGGNPQFPPSAQAGLAEMTPKPTPADAASAAVVSPSQVPDAGKPNRNAGPVASPSEARDAGPPNRDTPTQAQLLKYNEADRVAGESAALGQSASAVQQAGAAEADKLQKIGDFQSQVVTESQRQLAERQQKAQNIEAARQKELDSILAEGKSIRDTKIDRKADHPILNAIAIILGGIGQAFSHNGRNLGAEAVHAQIERKVAGQMQDLEKRRQGLAAMRDQFGLQREADKDILATADAHRIAYLDDAVRQTTAMANQLESPVAKANAQKLIADLGQKKQEIIGNASDRIYAKLQAEQARKDRLANEAASRAVAIRGQNLEDKRFYYGQAQQEREHMATLSAQLLERGDKLAAERAKRTAELGIFDPSTGNAILTPAGNAKMAQADQLEAQARREQDPSKARAILDNAQQLRDSANTNDAALGRTAEGAKDATRILSAVTNVQKNIDAASEMLKGGPSAFNKEAWVKITDYLEGVKTNYAQIMGDKISVKMLEAIDQITGINPNDDSLWGGGGLFERTANKGKALSALDTISSQMKSTASTTLLANGIQTPWSPSTPAQGERDDIGKGGGGEAPGAIQRINKYFNPLHSYDPSGPSGQTAAEAGGDPGAIRKLGELITKPLGGGSFAEYQFDAASQAPGKDFKGRTLPPSAYGIDPADDAKVRAKVAESAKVGNKKYGQIIDTLAQPLLSDRPGLASGVARLIHDEDPALLNDVLTRIASSPGGGAEKAKALAEIAKSPADKLNQRGAWLGPTPSPNAPNEPIGNRPFGLNPGLSAAHAVANLIGDSDPRIHGSGIDYPGVTPPTHSLPPIQVPNPADAGSLLNSLPSDQRPKVEAWMRANGYLGR